MAVTKIGIHRPDDFDPKGLIYTDVIGPHEFEVFVPSDDIGAIIGTCHEDVGLVTWWRAVSPAEAITWIEDQRDDLERECEGHESLAGAHMGETTYCDGSCS